MRLLLMAALVSVVFVGFAARTSCLPAAVGERQAGLPRQAGFGSTAEEATAFGTYGAGMYGAGRSGRPSGDGRSEEQQADLSRSGRDFLEVCSGVGSEGGKGSEAHGDAGRVSRDATCLGWVAGFAEGFLVHDELLSVPRRDRLACVPNGESAVEIVRVMKRYLEKNPEKAHRATRYIASLALAGAFPCRGGR